ncbi:hypothetical protein ACEQPO_10470 [Bacillus sp. SL00103]
MKKMLSFRQKKRLLKKVSGTVIQKKEKSDRFIFTINQKRIISSRCRQANV